VASLIFDSCVDDCARGAIDFDTDTFYAMLVTSSYTPDKATHIKRSDVTDEVIGAGYTAGGSASAVTVTKDTTNHRVTVAFANVVWPASTITAKAAVLYKRRGGAASADELVAYVDFGASVSSTSGNFTVTFSTPLTLQN
jgi:hypothetical protein